MLSTVWVSGLTKLIFDRSVLRAVAALICACALMASIVCLASLMALLINKRVSTSASNFVCASDLSSGVAFASLITAWFVVMASSMPSALFSSVANFPCATVVLRSYRRVFEFLCCFYWPCCHLFVSVGRLVLGRLVLLHHNVISASPIWYLGSPVLMRSRTIEDLWTPTQCAISRIDIPRSLFCISLIIRVQSIRLFM